MVDVNDCQGEGRAVTLQYAELHADHVVQRPAIAEPGQRIGPHLREGHQVIALITNPFLGISDFAHELQGWIKDALHFSAQFLPDSHRLDDHRVLRFAFQIP